MFVVEKSKKGKLELEADLKNNDPRYTFKTPNKSKSSVWQRFKLVVFEGTPQNYARCDHCKDVLAYSAKSGTGGLLRHSCNRTIAKAAKAKAAAPDEIPQKNEDKADSEISGGAEDYFPEFKQEQLMEYSLNGGNYQNCPDMEDDPDLSDFHTDQLQRMLLIAQIKAARAQERAAAAQERAAEAQTQLCLSKKALLVEDASVHKTNF